MAITYSGILRLPLLAGGNSNIWGGIENDAATLAEKSVTGVTTIDLTDGSVTLSANNGREDQARYAILKFVGQPTTARTVIVPTLSKLYTVINATDTPGVTVTVATTIGGQAVQAGTKAVLYVDAVFGIVRAVAPANSAVFFPSNLASFARASVPPSGFMTLKYVRTGNLVVATVAITTVPTLATATMVFDTSPVILAGLSPVVPWCFPMQVNEGGTRRESFLQVEPLGADWFFSRVLGTYGAAATRSLYTVGAQPIAYPLV